MDNFSEIYRIEGVAAILSAMALGEKYLGETTRLNQGLCVLGEILDDVAKELKENEQKK